MKQTIALSWLVSAVLATKGPDSGKPSEQDRFFWQYDSRDNFDISDMPSMTNHGFAALPFTNCFSKDQSQQAKYDIAVLGAPLDTVRYL